MNIGKFLKAITFDSYGEEQEYLIIKGSLENKEYIISFNIDLETKFIDVITSPPNKDIIISIQLKEDSGNLLLFKTRATQEDLDDLVQFYSDFIMKASGKSIRDKVLKEFNEIKKYLE